MAITSIKTGSSFTNLIKYNDFLAGNTAYNPIPPNSYESIATVTVGSGGSARQLLCQQMTNVTVGMNQHYLGMR